MSTLTEPKPLVAGRELNAIVAEKVMGTVCVCGSNEIGAQCCNEFPNYSTEIADAWLVVGMLRQHHWHLLMNDTMAAYRAVFFTTADTANWDRFSVSPTDRWAFAETAPLAICLAALKAIDK